MFSSLLWLISDYCRNIIYHAIPSAICMNSLNETFYKFYAQNCVAGLVYSDAYYKNTYTHHNLLPSSRIPQWIRNGISDYILAYIKRITRLLILLWPELLKWFYV